MPPERSNRPKQDPEKHGPGRVHRVEKDYVDRDPLAHYNVEKHSLTKQKSPVYIPMGYIYGSYDYKFLSVASSISVSS
ncbi:hypothetical protein D3C86_1137690 [compost metagenome]